ncbi:hypothetical protein [Pelagibius sp.]|uniref:hypothetical protein n=1 Tax=Pelagibius sp. TaxID=1931238 RepID=UPI00262E258E|nr:hypothetical protein [Pelagibius sp.]
MAGNPRALLLTVLRVGVLALVPLSAAESAKLPPENERLLLYLQTLQSDTLEPEAARNQCISLVYRVPESESLREIAAGFFQEPTTNSLVVFCELLVEAVSRGRLTPETVNEALRGRERDTQLHAAGELFRALHFVYTGLADPLSEPER